MNVQTETNTAPKAKRVRKAKEKKVVAPVVIEPTEEEVERLDEEATAEDMVQNAIEDAEDDDEVNELLAAADEKVDLAEMVKAVKRRKASQRERDDSGKVVRKGRNLSGNQPFRTKPYFYDLDAKKTPDYDKAFQAAPMQVRLILKYMEEEGITTEDDAMIGAEIAGGAINSGKLQSKIDPAALFAYYRRVMERLGLVLAVGE